MKKLIYLFLIWFIAVPTFGQRRAMQTTFEIGSGSAAHSNTPFNWGYHQVGAGLQYALNRFLSVEGYARYHCMDGQGFGVSHNGTFNIGALQRFGGLGLSFGPRISIPIRQVSELSFGARGGMLFQRIRQPLYKIPYQYGERYYAPVLLPYGELSVRYGFWIWPTTGLDFGMHYQGTFTRNKQMKIERGELESPFSALEGTDDLGRVFEEETRAVGNMQALTLSVGIRTKLGYAMPPVTAAQFDLVDNFKWGLLIGAQGHFPNGQTTQWTTGIHAGLFLTQRLMRNFYLQAEPQVKFSPARMPSIIFEDYYSADPVNFGYAYRQVQVAAFTMWELPLLLRIQSGKRHAWLVGVRPSVNFIRIEDNMGGSVTNGLPVLNTFDQIDYRQGMRRGDVGFSAGYERAVNDVWGISLRYTQGFSDLTYDNFFKSIRNHYNTDLQASIRMRL